MSDLNISDLILTLESDLFLGKKISGNNYQTMDYIVASTLKGALLTKIRSEICTQDSSTACDTCQHKTHCEFIQIRNAKIIVRPGCFIAANKCETHQLLPITPFTINKCKICDTMVDSTQTFIQNQELTLNCPNSDCSTNRKIASTQKVSGSYCVTCHKIHSDLPKGLRTNVGIDPTTKSIAKGMLYFYEIIERNTVFKSQIITSSPLIQNYLNKLDSITLGRGTSRGLGSVHIQMKPLNSQQELNSVQDAIKNSFQKTGKIAFVNVTNLCNLRIDKKLISYPYISTINCDGLNLELQYSFGTHEKISGWALNTDSQKPRLLTASPGSLFCYKPRTEPSPDQIAKLAKLEFLGIGEEPLINNSFNQILFWRD